MLHPPKNILLLHSRINAAPWKYLFFTTPAGFLHHIAPKRSSASSARFSAMQ